MERSEQLGNVLLRVAFVAASIQAQSCSLSKCNEGCASFVSVTGHLATPPSDLSGAAVMLCWNSKCSSGSVGSIVADGPTFTAMEGSFPSQVVLSSEGTGSLLRAEISGGSGYLDGDVYELSVVDSSGTVMYTMSGTASYTVSEVCDTRCSTAMLDLRPVPPSKPRSGHASFR